MALTERKRKGIIIAGSIVGGLIGLVVLAFMVLVVIGLVVGPRATTTAGADRTASSSAPASTTAAPTSAPATTSAPAAPDTSKAAGALAGLTVKDAAADQGDGHAHPSFHMDEDPDGNGCITRRDVLRRDLTAMTLDAKGCSPQTGTLTSPYTGAAIAYEVDDNDVRADQVVSSANAWLTGATDWDEAKRTAFGNDPLNLITVEGPLTRQRNGEDAASWLPPATEYRCDYVARQIAVKAKYGLWVTPAEKTAISDVLSACPGQSAFTEDTSTPGLGQGDLAQ